MTKPRKHHVQLTLDTARRPIGHGGWRPGAGRKPRTGAISHDARPAIDRRHPQHVTLRIVGGVRSIARDWLMTKIRTAFQRAHKPAFRIVEFNVLSNHLHLIIEASSARALATGMQGLEIRLARRLNLALKRHGKLFATRYHARALKTPRDVRNVLRYVLCNRKHHSPGLTFSKQWIDPYSSAPWFDGWATPIIASAGWMRELLSMEPPNVKPTAWLLTTGWKHHGLLHIDDAPA